METNDYFKKNISYLLDSKIITVDTILRLTNHNSPSLVSMWKTGERNIMTNDAIKIANHLNITVDDLINRDLSINDKPYDELELLFSKNKDILTEDDKEMIRFVVEKRKREIDKQLGKE